VEQALAAIPAEVRTAREPRARAAEVAWGRTKRTRRAIQEVRALPALPTLPRGGHLRAMRSDAGFGYVARSFGGIYVLVLVFGGPFEELAAKRALARTVPAVERLVVALPPLDPTPTKGAAAIARRPRRR
jgi:hypothetical protein